MAQIEIPALEQGTTRVFSLSLSDSAAEELRNDPAAQERLLGTSGLHTDGIEVFRLSDFGDMGLSGYLREGVDAREDDLKRDERKLAALEGWVMLVHSSAFKGEATTLEPSSEVTLIGTYVQETPAPGDVPLESAAAQPYTAPPQPATRPVARGGAAGATAVIGLIVLAVLVIWWAVG